MPSDEESCYLAILNKEKNENDNIIFFTEKGYLKKSKLSEYNITRNTGVKALTLEKDDSIKSVVITKEDKVGMLTARGQFVMCETKNIRAIGRVAKGVKGINLNPGDKLVYASIIPSTTKELVSISEKGYTKRTSLNEFNVTNRGVKGGKIHVLKDTDDKLISFLPINQETEIIVVANTSQIKIKLNEISLLSKGAQGVKTIKTNGKVIGITIF